MVDGAGQEVADRARSLGATVVAEPRPRGPAAARNLGAARARSEVLIFIDADVEARPDLVGRVALMLAGDDEPSAVFGSYDDDPPAPGLVSRYRNLLHHWVHQHSRQDASTFWSGCGAVRRGVFEETGGFPERYSEPSIEDIAFGARLRRRGHRIRLDPTLQVRHLKRWTFLDVVRTDLFKRAVPWTELMVRRRHLLNDLNVDATGRVSVALVGLLLVGLSAAVARPALGVSVLIVAAGALLAVNLAFYRFLARRGGWWFAVRAVPLHWLYYLICGVGFVVGSLRAVVLKGPVERPAEKKAEAA